MSCKLFGTSMLAIAAGTSILLAVVPSASVANDELLRLAMHDMMPMQSQGQSGGSGGSMGDGKMNDNMMRTQQPNPSGQTGGTGGKQSQGSMGQGGSSGQTGSMQPQGQSDSMSSGAPMDDNMRMQQGSGQMGRGMQSQGAMGQGGMSGQAGGTTNDNMMRMMNDHMRMMSDGMRGGMPGMAMGPGMVDMTDRLDGRLAFLRAELRITDAQSSVWNTFAAGLRSSRNHLLEARQQLNQPYAKPADRLEQYERHLAARLEALKSARAAFTQLYASLDDVQKRTADELVVPFIATF